MKLTIDPVKKRRTRKGPTFSDAWQQPDAVEMREYRAHCESMEPPSSIVLYFHCPFCRSEVKAYLWSLSGSGKRCDCGAMFSSRGYGIHWKEGGGTMSDDPQFADYERLEARMDAWLEARITTSHLSRGALI